MYLCIVTTKNVIKMKKLTLVFSLLLLVCYSFADMQHVTCEEIILQPRSLDPTDAAKPIRKSPVKAPSVGIEDCSLIFLSSIQEGEVLIYNEDGEVEFATIIGGGCQRIALPPYLTGTYIIEIFQGQHCYWGYVNL